MDACPLLITSIVAVKPEDQGTFFQDFLGLSGYLCSIPEMLRTTTKPNGLRYAPSGVLVGGMRERHFGGINFKPRKLPENAARTPSRVHALLGALTECKTH